MRAKIYYQTGSIRPEDFYSHLQLLNDAERRRALRYQHHADKLRFVCTRTALKRLLAQLTTSSPEQITIQQTHQGQPFCEHAGALWQISVSHSEHHYLIAASAAPLAIGTDLESCGQHTAFSHDMLASFCHPNEITLLKALPCLQQSRAAQSLWSAKEALLKACGSGLRSDPCALLLPVPLPAHAVIRAGKQCFTIIQQSLPAPDPEHGLLLTFCTSSQDAEWLHTTNPAHACAGA